MDRPAQLKCRFRTRAGISNTPIRRFHRDLQLAAAGGSSRFDLAEHFVRRFTLESGALRRLFAYFLYPSSNCSFIRKMREAEGIANDGLVDNRRKSL
jgi:hypothetical protein